MFAIATEESITIHKNSDGSLKNGLTYSLISEKDNGALLQAMKITPDGSKIVLFFGSHLNIYKFDSVQGGVDPSSKQSVALSLHEKTEVIIEDVSISNDDKIIAICDKKYMYTMNLEDTNETRQEVHEFPIGSINSLAFLPHSTREQWHHLLFVTYGKNSTTLQVNAREGIIDDPSLLLRCLAVCDDETMIELISEHQELLCKRDVNGLNLAELAVKDDRPAVLRKILEIEPSIAWSSLGVVRYLVTKSKENIVEK